MPSNLVTIETPVPGTLIIGLGNLLRGDDGVGVHVAQALAEVPLPQDVEVVEGGTRGLELVNLMEGWPRVILVDAADVGQAPGEFVRFEFDEVHLVGDDQHLSIHSAGLRDALLLAQVLNVLPDEVIIYGVQPARLDWDDSLSPVVEALIPRLVGSILAELGAPGSFTHD
jgi:hydrogenase maturation protease